MVYAGVWKRFFANIVDSIFVGVLGLFAIIPIFLVYKTKSIIFWIIVLLVFICTTAGYFLYFVIFESSKLQATPGKLILNVKVVNSQGQRISFFQALGRNFIKLFLTPFLSVVNAILVFNKTRQNLYDFAAKTFVISSLEEPADKSYAPGKATKIAVAIIVAVMLFLQFGSMSNISILDKIGINSFKDVTVGDTKLSIEIPRFWTAKELSGDKLPYDWKKYVRRSETDDVKIYSYGLGGMAEAARITYRKQMSLDDIWNSLTIDAPGLILTAVFYIDDKEAVEKSEFTVSGKPALKIISITQVADTLSYLDDKPNLKAMKLMNYKNKGISEYIQVFFIIQDYPETAFVMKFTATNQEKEMIERIINSAKIED
ncbi:MAG: RDD family protein [Endomicrobia bacterium]|nr:RDD family protein [Endomicrobiia bacterium]